ncbi:hypothetical protein RvVAT039_41400 [Agrobacterium vitis]|nr:hypothetical protein RvVAT039_41400 [Agrobacterium vitis]
MIAKEGDGGAYQRLRLVANRRQGQTQFRGQAPDETERLFGGRDRMFQIKCRKERQQPVLKHACRRDIPVAKGIVHGGDLARCDIGGQRKAAMPTG